jgi:hypothetical protein
MMISNTKLAKPTISFTFRMNETSASNAKQRQSFSNTFSFVDAMHQFGGDNTTAPRMPTVGTLFLTHQKQHSRQVADGIFHQSLANSLGEEYEPTPFPANHQHSKNTANTVQYNRNDIDPELASILREVAHLIIVNDGKRIVAIPDATSSSAQLSITASSCASATTHERPPEHYSEGPQERNKMSKKTRRPSYVLPPHRQRNHQQSHWDDHYQELVAYQQKSGHCCVPNNCESNLELSRWVKRQRSQYKQLKEGKPSTMSVYRFNKLKEIGFVWDAHALSWKERLNELWEFHKQRGHCNVPSHFPENPQLATWVKCQRREYKKCLLGKKSHATTERIAALQALQFQWEIRRNSHMSHPAR